MPSNHAHSINSAQRHPRSARCVRWLTAAHLIGAAALWYLIWEISESHWLGSVVTFLPRLPWLLPGVVLLVASLLTWSKAFWVNLATMLFVLLSIAEFNVPWQRWNEPASTSTNDNQTLRLVSCNVQNFAPNFSLVLREVQRAKPDVIAFQEAIQIPRLLREHFDGWHQIQVRGLWVGSKWPLRLLGEYQSEYFAHLSGIAVEVDAPFGKFLLTDLHLMTARKSLIELRPLELFSGESQLALSAATIERIEEARQARAFIAEHQSGLPVVVAGDFNMPTSSSVYRTSFGDFTNAFESSALGFGFTAPCKRFRWWPTNTPWQRIDHILAGESWHVRECHIGQRDGSDHRLIATTLLLR